LTSWVSKTKTAASDWLNVTPPLSEEKIKGALVTATRSHYDASVLEIIAPVCLRKQLNLKDGNKVKVEILTQF